MSLSVDKIQILIQSKTMAEDLFGTSPQKSAQEEQAEADAE